MLRVASFNIENLDTSSSKFNPSLQQRAPALRSMFRRLHADVLCLQEVHGQEIAGHTAQHPKRDLSALDFIVQDSEYAQFDRAVTHTSANVPYDKRNLVILSRWPIAINKQYKNNFIDKLQYRKVTAQPKEEIKDVGWERPVQHIEIEVPQLGRLHVINLHLKSRNASNVAGQKINNYTWSHNAAWAEGYFLSSIKRVGQALETRILLDQLFTGDPEAKIIVCGDFNAEPGEVPVEAICGRVENTGNPDLRATVMIPCSLAIGESVRFSHLHHGQANLLDHMLMSQSLFSYFKGSNIFNENLHDESLPFASDLKFPESDHAPFVAEFCP